MRLCVSIGEFVCDLETDEPLPTFDVVETLLNRCSDTVITMWWEVHGDDDEDSEALELEPLELSEPPADNA